MYLNVFYCKTCENKNKSCKGRTWTGDWSFPSRYSETLGTKGRDIDFKGLK